MSETTSEKITRLKASLESVRKSIEEAELTASLSAYGRSVVRPNLESLYNRERYLEEKIDKLESDTGGFKYLRFIG